MSLVNDSPRMATSRTVTPVKLMSLDRDAFDALFAHQLPLRLIFQRLIEERISGRAGEDQFAPIKDETKPLIRSRTTTN